MRDWASHKHTAYSCYFHWLQLQATRKGRYLVIRAEKHNSPAVINDQSNFCGNSADLDLDNCASPYENCAAYGYIIAGSERVPKG